MNPYGEKEGPRVAALLAQPIGEAYKARTLAQPVTNDYSLSALRDIL